MLLTAHDLRTVFKVQSGNKRAPGACTWRRSRKFSRSHRKI